jgi:hypothetical protein
MLLDEICLLEDIRRVLAREMSRRPDISNLSSPSNYRGIRGASRMQPISGFQEQLTEVKFSTTGTGAGEKELDASRSPLERPTATRLTVVTLVKSARTGASIASTSASLTPRSPQDEVPGIDWRRTTRRGQRFQ